MTFYFVFHLSLAFTKYIDFCFWPPPYPRSLPINLRLFVSFLSISPLFQPFSLCLLPFHLFYLNYVEVVSSHPLHYILIYLQFSFPQRPRRGLFRGSLRKREIGDRYISVISPASAQRKVFTKLLPLVTFLQGLRPSHDEVILGRQQ